VISLLAGIMVMCTVFSVVPSLVADFASNPETLSAFPALADAIASGQTVDADVLQNTIFGAGNEGLTFIWMPELFSTLPFGKPIEGLSSTYDPNWWARDFLKRIADDDKNRERSAELERTLAKVWGLETEAKVRTAVRDLNAEAGSETFDIDAVLASWRKFRASMRPRGDHPR